MSIAMPSVQMRRVTISKPVITEQCAFSKSPIRSLLLQRRLVLRLGLGPGDRFERDCGQRGFHGSLTLAEESTVRTSLALLRVGPAHLEVGLDVDDRAGVSRCGKGSTTHPLPRRARVGCWPSLKEKTVCQEVWPSVYSAGI
jgi:hypothetical protein